MAGWHWHFGLDLPLLFKMHEIWSSAASVAVVATSCERHEGKAGMVLFAGKTV